MFHAAFKHRTGHNPGPDHNPSKPDQLPEGMRSCIMCVPGGIRSVIRLSGLYKDMGTSSHTVQRPSFRWLKKFDTIVHEHKIKWDITKRECHVSLVEVWRNLAVKVPQWVLIDLISWDHVESESEGCQAGTLGRFSEIDDLCGTGYTFFQLNMKI